MMRAWRCGLLQIFKQFRALTEESNGGANEEFVKFLNSISLKI